MLESTVRGYLGFLKFASTFRTIRQQHGNILYKQASAGSEQEFRDLMLQLGGAPEEIEELVAKIKKNQSKNIFREPGEGIKQAQLNPFGVLADTIKASAIASLVFGVPAGVALHVLDKRTSPNVASERSIKKERDFYRYLTSDIETNLARAR